MRYSLQFSMCAALSLGLTGVAQAQTAPPPAIPSGVEVRVDGGDPLKDVKYVYQNAQHCEKNADITIYVAGWTSTNPDAMEVWVGPKGTDCSKGKSRDLPASGAAPCRNVEIENDVKPGTTPTIDLKTRELFATDGEVEADGDAGVDVSVRCDNGEKWVYILALGAPSLDSGNTDVEDPTKFYKVGFYVDDILPGAPTKVSTESGESQVTVSWTSPSDILSESDSSIRIYYDKDAIEDTGTPCTSTVLVAGAKPGDSKTKLTYDNADGTKYSAAPSALGLTDLNTRVPVAVAAVDGAGNVGAFSEIKCVAKVETLGFDEVCKMDPKCDSGFDTCSTTPWRTGGLAGALALVSCAVVFARRRRRNV